MGQVVRVVLVGVTGFEPAAFRSQSGCATKLRYTPVAPGGYTESPTASYGLGTDGGQAART